MKNCAVIYNPNSGKGINEKQLIKLEQMLNLYEYHAYIYKTEYRGHAREIIKSLKHIDLVISIGGDGTFNEVMTGNFERKNMVI